MPTVHRGGIKAVAIATPATAAETLGRAQYIGRHGAARQGHAQIKRSRTSSRHDFGRQFGQGAKGASSGQPPQERRAKQDGQGSALRQGCGRTAEHPLLTGHRGQRDPKIGDMERDQHGAIIAAGESVTRPNVAMLHNKTTSR